MNRKRERSIKYALRILHHRNGTKLLPLLGKRGLLAEAFREVAKAIQWWYKGPGKNIHYMTGPHDYSHSKPFCHVGASCVRCQKAVIARAAIVHDENRLINFGDGMYPPEFFRQRLNPKVTE